MFGFDCDFEKNGNSTKPKLNKFCFLYNYVSVWIAWKYSDEPVDLSSPSRQKYVLTHEKEAPRTPALGTGNGYLLAGGFEHH